MAKFCTGCGKALADGLMFCTECGTKAAEGAPAQADTVKEEAVAAEVKQEPVIVAAQPQQPVAQPQQQYIPPQQPPAQGAQQTENHSASTAHFFWMMLVYSLPLIGWLICIIMAFAPKNESKKHFARAILIWAIVGIVFSVIGLILMSLLGGSIAELLSEIPYSI